MSSSGLIYAVIVGAWAAYLVPMWLRRQDELNEARPTERFGTAIRLLSGKAGMERRYAKEAERRHAEAGFRTDDDDADGNTPDGSPNAVDVRAFAEPRTMTHDVPAVEHRDAGGAAAPSRTPGNQAVRHPADRKAAERTKRAQVLARRRRTTMVLFLCFSVGVVVAAVGGVAFLWAPAVPAALLSAYIAHLRTQERRRFHVLMDRRRAEEAAVRLREQRASSAGTTLVTTSGPPSVSEPADRIGDQAGAPSAVAAERDSATDRRVLVEQTDHAEWVDEERARVRQQPEGEGWDPVPVPLPTYVNAPVAPRTARGVDLDAPDAWSSARSTTAPTGGIAGTTSTSAGEPGRRRERTPLFDQMADKERPRAAGE